MPLARRPYHEIEIDQMLDALQQVSEFFDPESEDLVLALRRGWEREKASWHSGRGAQERFHWAQTRLLGEMRALCEIFQNDIQLPPLLAALVADRRPLRLPPRQQLPPLLDALPGYEPAPYRPSADFIDCTDLLLRLAQPVLYANPPLLVLLTGVPLAGKTELAAELCYRYAAYLLGIHWLDCTQDLEAQVRRLGDPALSVEETLADWRSADHLVILENLDALPEAEIQTWLARLAGARLLGIGWKPGWPKNAAAVRFALRPWGLDCLRQMMRRLGPRLGTAGDGELDALADFLGRLPLAVSLAARYLEARPALTPDQFRRELETQALRHPVFANPPPPNPTNHPALRATLQRSWEALAGQPTAQRLLQLCSWCAAHTPIPRYILLAAFRQEHPGEPGEQETSFRAALQRLYDLGLLEASPAGPRLQPLVQSYFDAADRGAPDPLAQALFEAVEHANQVNAPPPLGLTVKETERLRRILPHLAAFAGRAGALHPAQSAWLYNRAGLAQLLLAEQQAEPVRRTQELQQARRYFAQALEIEYRLRDAGQPARPRNMFNVFQNLALTLEHLHQAAQALNCYREALAVEGASLNASGLPRDRFDLAMLYQKVDQPNNMLRTFTELLRPEQYPPEALQNFSVAFPELVEGANQCTQTLDRHHRPLEAIGLLRALQAFLQQANGPAASQARVHWLLALRLHAQGDTAGAAEHYEAALRLGGGFPEITLERAAW